jgi:uncharacterized protein (TIGR03437 family)
MLQSLVILLAIILSSALTGWGQVYNISTLAGNGTAGFADGSGTAAQLNLPGAIYLTPSGSLYIADGLNNRVRLLSKGSVTTVAGNGTLGYGGDGAAATSAFLSDPRGVAVDSSGNIYISDTGNWVVRKVTPAGTITTYAGNYGFGSGYSGDGVVGGATNAQLSAPLGLAVDSAGNIYICDAGTALSTTTGLIRKVTASTNTMTTAVGSTAPTQGKLQHPAGITMDSAGNMYIANSGNSKILKFTAASGTLTTYAGASTGFSGDGGLATLAGLGDPQGVALDAAGNLYIADTVNNRIRKVSAATGIITTIAGTGKPGYSGDGGAATSAQLNSPQGIAVDSAGNVYIADTQNSVIRVLQPSLPTVSAGGVGNAASFQPQISPGALASVFGTGFGLGIVSPAANPGLPTSAGGVSVTVNGQAAPLYYVSPAQINFQVPWETTVGTASVGVTVSGGNSNTISVPVVSAGPGLFTGNGTAIVQNYPDYSLNTASNPAPAGSTIIAYLTGSGPVNPPVADGALAPTSPLATATSSYSASFGSASAQVSFLGLSPGYVGLVQANIVVPPGLAGGVSVAYPLTVTIAGQTSNSGTVYVK